MQLNDQTNFSGIVQMCENTSGLGIGKINDGTAYASMTSAQKQTWNYWLSLINQWLQIGHYYAWTTNKNWDFDDSNHTTFPFATTTLVDDQRDYTLPSDLLGIRSVEVLDSNGKYYSLVEMSNDSGVLWTEREQEPSGKPTHYRKVGLSLKLYPAPDTAVLTATAGLRLRYDREMDFFTVADTTQEPGFATMLHPICYYGPSWEFAMVNNVPQIAQMCERMLGQWPGIREIAEQHYNLRDKNDVTRVSRLKKSYK